MKKHWATDDSESAKIVRFLFLKNKTIRETMAEFKCGQQRVYDALRYHGMKSNGQKRMWSLNYPCCQGPKCKYTKDGKTSRRHHGNGLCTSCGRKKKYREDFAYRERLLEKSREHALTYTPKGRAPDKSGSKKRYNKLCHAKGFRTDAQTGMTVHVPWHYDYYGQPIPLRILKRYAVEREAMCDLDDGKRIFKQVPLESVVVPK